MDDFKANAVPNSVVSFVKKIVNRSDVGGSAGASASSSSATSRHRTSRHSTASIFSRNSVSSSSRYTASSSMRRASRVAENISGGVPSGSLLPNISKLKERVAQGGSKVMASFKSDSATSSGPSRSHPGVASAMAASAVAAVAATAAATAASARAASSSSSSSAFGDKSASTRARSASIDRKNTSSGCSSSSKSKVPSQSSLTNEQLTAHLTDEERSILEKVFLKEEEFHRESVFKSTSLNINKQLRRLSTRCLANDATRFGQAVEGHSGIMAAASPLDLESPSSSSGASGAATSPLLLGCCRVCRKNIEAGEKHNYCDTCNQPVCEDCSSYSNIQAGEVYMCNVCRRRRSSAYIPGPNSDLSELALGTRRVSALPGVTRDFRVTLQGTCTPDTLQSPKAPMLKRRISAAEMPADRQEGEHKAPHSPNRRLAERHHSDDKDFRGSSSSSFLQLFDRPRTTSPEQFSSESRACDSAATTSTNYSHRCPSSETLSQRSSSEPRTAEYFVSNSPVPTAPSRSPGSRRSLTASDSSLEEMYLERADSVRRRSTRRSRVLRQKRSLPSEDRDNSPYGNVFQDDLSTGQAASIGFLGVNEASKSASCHTSHLTLRHTASDAGMHFDFPPSLSPRRRSDSPISSVDFSDIRISSPPAESMSPSSPDYIKSPRQSADSDLLTVNLPSMGAPSIQRRSIPCVLVDPATDINHLSLKDCFPRRSSTGRALPKIPIEQSRSLLDLPGKDKGSTRSLDLPHDQPRRASAPEGENIRIVIDDVDSSGYRKSQIERVILHKDSHDINPRTKGFGVFVTGGKLSEFDNRLYTYVSWVISSSPADKMGLKPGDKILEWDAKCLINCTYEQVISIIDASGNSVELIIEPLNREEKKGSFFHQKRRLSNQVSFEQRSFDLSSMPATHAPTSYSGHQPPVQLAINEMVYSDQGMVAPFSPTASCGPQQSRRKLPTPATSHSQAEISIEFSVEPDRQELVATLMTARGLTCTTQAFIHLEILPGEQGFKACSTELSSTMEWNETLIFQPFPIERLLDMAMDLSIWEREASGDKLLAETIIPLANITPNQCDWWPLLVPAFSQVKKSPSTDFKNRCNF